VFWRPEDLLVWEYDAGFDRRPPTAVALPGTAEEVAAVVRAARDAGASIVPRGAGTGLSGGTIACADAIVVSTARMREIVSIDPIARIAVVEPGVPNLAVTTAAREKGLFFAPDPASQRISTIGGNAATNAGGPHALRYGSMTNHVLGVELVLPTGECVRFGGEVVDLPGYDCVPFIVGSEGTIGIITKVWLRLLPLPEDVRTFVAVFADIEHGARAASAIIASGVVPAAMEMLDQVTIGALNAAFEVHLPADAGSLLLVEVEGLREETEDWATTIERILRKNGATDVRSAETVAEAAGREQQAREHERVRVDHPLELTERGAEVVLKPGKRHVENGIVDDDHEQTQAQHPEAPPPALIGAAGAVERNELVRGHRGSHKCIER